MSGDDTMPRAHQPDTRLTYDDFLLFPDDGRRHELIDGEHYVTPSPNRRHQQLVGRLYFALEAHLRAHTVGEVYLAPFDVVLSEFDVVEPDLLVVTTDQRNILTDANVQGAPAIVVEILSPGTRRVDEKIKYGLFARAGVREYWVVDPELDVVRVFRRLPDRSFPRVAELAAEARAELTTPLLPAFALPLVDLFR
jgi:Uma2 family endonuclease